MVQGNPVGQRFSFGDRQERVDETASCSPKINVEVLGSNAGGGPNGRTRSATISFSGAVKTLMFSEGDMLISLPTLPAVKATLRSQLSDGNGRTPVPPDVTLSEPPSALLRHSLLSIAGEM